MFISLPLWQRPSFTWMDQRLCLWTLPGPSRALDPQFDAAFAARPQHIRPAVEGRSSEGNRSPDKSATKAEFNAQIFLIHCKNQKGAFQWPFFRSISSPRRSSGRCRPRSRCRACGTEDGLLGPNRAYRDMFREAGLDLTYEEGPGNHNWEFWDKYIRHVLDWLPLDEAKAGLSSGNVVKE